MYALDALPLKPQLIGAPLGLYPLLRAAPLTRRRRAVRPTLGHQSALTIGLDALHGVFNVRGVDKMVTRVFFPARLPPVDRSTGPRTRVLNVAVARLGICISGHRCFLTRSWRLTERDSLNWRRVV